MRKSTIASILCLLGVALLLPAAVQAESAYLYGVSLFYGIGGSSDAEPDAGFSNSSYQLGFSLNTEPQSRLGVRYANLDLGGDRFGKLTGADLTYLTIGGEYRYRTSYYDSGLYLGLGGYRLRGRDATDGSSWEDTNIGLALGLTGEFSINRRWSVLVEISGHWADLEEAKVFAVGHAGIGVYF